MLILIAGPQSSGKTTVFNYVRKQYPQHHYLPEINPYTFKGKNHLGAAFVTAHLEEQIVEKDIETIQKLYTNKTIVAETGLFHCLYLQKCSGKRLANKYYNTYLSLYKNLNPLLLFIDTKPPVSFSRRKPIYEKRLLHITDVKEKQKMMKKYENTIHALYPLWISYYKKFPFTKIRIPNSRKSLREILNAIDSLI